MSPKKHTIVDEFDNWLESFTPKTLNFMSGLLMLFAVVFLFKGCFDMGLVGFVLFILMVKLSSYIKKKSHASHPAIHPDVIDAAFTEHKPETPKVQSPPKIHPAYTNTLAELEACSAQLDRQFTQLDQFLDDFFGDSAISKAKYMRQVELARKSAANNLEKARNAVNLFGDEKPPTAVRMEVLQQYVSDSRKTVRDVDAIIDELLRVDQSNVQMSSEFLDENLESLRQATSAYKEKASI